MIKLKLLWTLLSIFVISPQSWAYTSSDSNQRVVSIVMSAFPEAANILSDPNHVCYASEASCEFTFKQQFNEDGKGLRPINKLCKVSKISRDSDFSSVNELVRKLSMKYINCVSEMLADPWFVREENFLE